MNHPPPTPHSVLGLSGGSKGWYISALLQKHPLVVVVCDTRRHADDLADDLRFFTPDTEVLVVSGWETLPFEPVSPLTDIAAARLRAVDLLSRRARCCLLFGIDGIAQRCMPPAFIARHTISLATGAPCDRQELLKNLGYGGFRPVSSVEEVGDLAIRGSVIDVFPSTSPFPVRIELREDRIHELRLFSSETQRSLEPIRQLQILPVRELFDLRSAGPWDHLRGELADALSAIAQELELPPREFQRITSALDQGVTFPGAELAQFAAPPPRPSFLELLPSDAGVVVVNELIVERTVDDFWAHIEERAARRAEYREITPRPTQLFLTPDELRTGLRSRERYYLDPVLIFAPELRGEGGHLTIRSENLEELAAKLKTRVGSGKAFTPLYHQIHRLRKRAIDVAIVVGTRQRAERLQRILLEGTIDAPIFEEVSGSAWSASSRRVPVVILIGQLSAGFVLPEEKIACIAEQEIFTERSSRPKGGRRISLKRIMSGIAQLQVGSFVVHTDYGIGRYGGLSHKVVDGKGADVIQLQYADSVLFVPVQHIAKIQKYVTAEGHEPPLDKLGSPRWLRAKEKVRAAVAELAGELIRLYAARSIVKGWRFEPAGAEDERFADSFPYATTVDQQKAIDETLRDLAAERPMDRLVCGDVGFGKTEVAIRAAFKCTQHARQVAVLVPTTILAEQHAANFRARFAEYPVKIVAVSRFHTAEENRKHLDALARGEVDIVIGTHRLLQRDVSFKDLGLLIIDEEHRFGVKQKERLKSLKKQVDVLTLTATPIPRTLHMALLGIRDVSIIATPPTDRRTIRTYIAERNEALIRDAILREIQRGGQVFYVRNRIEGIELAVEDLRRLVPEARFAFGHGQMAERELEGIMRRFLDREVDVLVATTIIESGIDIPSANTMIIERADAFGLAQLYQLRGRVGRSNQQAYAYLMVPPIRTLNEEAAQRLRALQALDDLGLGFNLALSDMEIRGAGNLLGKEQSGSVNAVGFELYSKILKEAVHSLKGEELDLTDVIDPEIKLACDAFIPEDFVPDLSERLSLYQRLANLRSDDDVRDFRDELRDRFGELPQPAEEYLNLMALRGRLITWGVAALEVTHDRFRIGFTPRSPLDIDKVISLVRAAPQKYRFSKSLLLVALRDRDGTPTIDEVRERLERIMERVQKSADQCQTALDT